MSEHHLAPTINRLKSGDHVCCLYETDEEYRSILIPLLRPGLEQGEKVICIVDPCNVPILIQLLQDDGCDVQSFLDNEQLRILTYMELLSEGEVFDPEIMIERLQVVTEQAVTMGYSALRLTVEMTWVLRDLPGSDRLIEYEARLNRIFPASQSVVICHYDRRCFDARILRDILHTHPLVVIGTEVYENFYYIPPNELLDENIGSAQLRYWLKSLIMRRQMEEALQNIYLNLEWEVKERTNALANANEILRENEAQLKEAQQLAQVGSWNWIVDTDTVTWSEELYRIAGREPGQPAPCYAEQPMLYTPESWTMLDDAVNHTLKTGAPYRLELQLVRPDNTLRWVFTKGTAVRDGDGRIVRLHGIIQDITESKQAEENLKASEKRYRSLILATTQVVWTTNAIGEVIDDIPSWREITGQSETEIKGWGWMNALHPEDRDRTAIAWRNALQTRSLCETEYRVRQHDGDYRRFALRSVPVLEDDGNIREWVGTISDITEKQKTEESLRNIQKLEAIGALAGGIAHDFNNLLSGIFGYINLACKYAADNQLTKIEQYMSKALDVFERAKALTHQLLTFAKGGEPVKKPFLLPELLKNTTAFALTGSNVNAAFDIEPDLWPCDVDENQITQVIDNIVINARQAMPEGGTVMVTAKNIPADSPVPPPLKRNKYVFISIRDQGTGIAKEYLSRIFDPFFTTKQYGSGLGLATSYSIISKHGGHISAESELHKGANFLIYLPAANSMATDKQIPVTGVYQGQGRVLVMDDEEYIRDLTGQMLENMGYTVECAADGNEAIRIFTKANSSSHPFDAVILDLTVPGGMGGKETIQKLIAISPSVKAIATSGYSDDPVMAKPHEYGFVAKLNKPFLDGQLGNVLGMVMNRNKMELAL
jgi:PAS domain S-box-containing protein